MKSEQAKGENKVKAQFSEIDNRKQSTSVKLKAFSLKISVKSGLEVANTPNLLGGSLEPGSLRLSLARM